MYPGWHVRNRPSGPTEDSNGHSAASRRVLTDAAPPRGGVRAPRATAMTRTTPISGRTAADGNDHIKRLTRSLELLLPAIVAETSLAYFREYLAREYLRHPQSDSAD